MDAKQGDWVQVRDVVLEPKDRAPQVPDDTKKTPLLLWVKGKIQCSANIGDTVEIETVTLRRVKGVLTAVNPSYSHSYGEYVPELAKIGQQVRNLLLSGDGNP